MIYGYDARTINAYGLKQMREISIAVRPVTLRALAQFLRDSADELESASVSTHWHKHLDVELHRELGCDVIVLAVKPDARS
jgi:hypothetical protein